MLNKWLQLKTATASTPLSTDRLIVFFMWRLRTTQVSLPHDIFIGSAVSSGAQRDVFKYFGNGARLRHSCNRRLKKSHNSYSCYPRRIQRRSAVQWVPKWPCTSVEISWVRNCIRKAFIISSDQLIQRWYPQTQNLARFITVWVHEDPESTRDAHNHTRILCALPLL